MIYLASPYSHPDASVREQRYIDVRDYTMNLIHQGVAAFSPIVYAHRMSGELGLGTTAQDWMTFNKKMLQSSNSLLVLCLNGWESSIGVGMEIEWAKAFELPVAYSYKMEYV